MSHIDKSILIIEDDIGLRSQLKWHLDDLNMSIVIVDSVADAITAVRQYAPAVIIQDLGLPPDPEGVTEGFRCIEEILSIAPSTKIIVLTGKSEHRNALKSIELGAFDFYFKPADPDTLTYAVNHALKLSELEKENNTSDLSVEPIAGIITASTKMKNICRMVNKIAKTNVTTTIIGESGTGKEVIARAIHSGNAQTNSPFVAINCAAVPESLMESELFGHEKGAFTGAIKSTKGKVELADGGTLFLDEIGDMPLSLQAKLLRFIQQRTIERVGGNKEIPVKLRIICATNKHLQAMVEEGSFREDLFYRIAEIIVDLPPLRDRGNDPALIATSFLKNYCKTAGIPELKFSKEALEAIESYHWPGNIREIENKIKSACVFAEGKLITAEDLSIACVENRPRTLNLKEARNLAEVEAIRSALEISQHNVSSAAKLLGVTRPTLYDMIKKHSLSLEQHFVK